jgi:hypothetical protein
MKGPPREGLFFLAPQEEPKPCYQGSDQPPPQPLQIAVVRTALFLWFPAELFCSGFPHPPFRLCVLSFQENELCSRGCPYLESRGERFLSSLI